jgi:hypothetical protein
VSKTELSFSQVVRLKALEELGGVETNSANEVLRSL